MKLNAQQQQVVDDLKEPILLNAPAGTGKTRVLACRVAHILETKAAAGAQILCLTFTNRACKELKERIVATAKEEGQAVVVKTIHSFCYSLLKEETKRQSNDSHDFLLYDDEDCKQLIDALPAAATAPPKALQALQNYIEFQKKQRVLQKLHDFTTPNEVLQAWFKAHGASLLAEYDAALADNHAVDFTDLITGAYSFLTDEDCCRRWRERFRFISVDEMQDTSEVEYAVISRLFPGRNVLLCGDYFQTIYEWRGSYPEYILEQFRKTYHPREITFTTNYRATQLLLKAAESCLNHLFGQVTVHHIYPQPGQAA
ncbi:UvrD-helicase domain-containing protein, partial [uncultured Megasphaera sp.]|uniref:UvrD-helicase domain-containing protein n=1 Tax=uncultured Megasphaera sp. TaxID=165188 RepID=UPI0025E75B50